MIFFTSDVQPDGRRWSKQSGPCASTGFSRLVAPITSYYKSGQITMTSHDLTPNGGLVRGSPLISGFSRLVNYYKLPR